MFIDHLCTYYIQMPALQPCYLLLAVTVIDSSSLLFCWQEVKVFSPPGNLIGTVSEACGIIRPKYQIFDATLPDSPLFEINGPICKFSCFCGDIDFPIKECVDKKHGITERHAGIISKKWGGFLKELFTDADSFGVSFPPDLDPKYKVLFLAACFLIVSTIEV